MEGEVAVSMQKSCLLVEKGASSIPEKHHSKLVSTGQVLQQALCTIAPARSPAFPAFLEVGPKTVLYSSLLMTLSKLTN